VIIKRINVVVKEEILLNLEYCILIKAKSKSFIFKLNYAYCLLLINSITLLSFLKYICHDVGVKSTDLTEIVP